MSPHRSQAAFACRTLLVVALAALGGRALGAAAVPAAKPAAQAQGKDAAAFKACSQRADLLFVRKCLQACMIDSKTNTRVMQSSVQRDECQLKCGNQPEKLAFLQSCMSRAGYPNYRPKK